MKIITLFLLSLCAGMIAPQQASAFNKESIIRWQTTQGAQVLYYPSANIPMLDIGVGFLAGSSYDGADEGLSTLTTRLLNQGNGSWDATHVAELLADTGAQYSAFNNQDMIILNLRTLTRPDALDQALKVFTSIINAPQFPHTALEREKTKQILELRHANDTPELMNQTTFFQMLYQDHPYGHPINGSIECVQHLSNQQVIDFYKRYFVAKNAVIVMVGAIDLPQAKQIAEQLVQTLPQGKRAPPLPLATPLAEGVDIIVPFESKQTVIRFGQVGVTHQDKDYYPLQVGNYILGGNPTRSLLQQELRERHGLTYGVTSQVAPMPGRGIFLIQFATQNQNTQTALTLTRALLTHFIKHGPTEEELVAAKQYLNGSFALSLSSNKNMVELLLKMGMYHLPNSFLTQYTEHVNSVSPNQIKLAFAHHFNVENLLLVTTGHNYVQKAH